MAQIKLKTKIDADFNMEMMSVFEKFEHQGKKYLPYLNTEQKGDEAVVYEKIIIPLFTDVLNYDKHKDFNPQATLSTGTIDNWIRNREGSPLIALEALRSNATQTEFIQHRQRLLSGYFDELDAKYAVLTNGVVFEVWNRIAEKSKGLFVTIDFREIYIKFIGKGIKAFVDEDWRKFSNLMTLKKENQYLDVEHIYPEPQLDISEELHFNNFLFALQERMEEVKEDVLAKFEYLKREYQECSELIKQYKEQTFLKIRKRYERAQKFIQSFETWQKTSPTNTSPEAFCLETMYVFFNRILLIRICEDKGIIQRKISNGGIKKYIEYRSYIKFSQVDYKALLKEAYQIMDRFYPHLFQIDIFDWYEIDNDILLRVLFTFNPYNFNKVDRDVLGKLYEKYLNREERKRLGEFYTPEEVIDYILDSVGYTRGSGIEGKKLLDPACGSGGFLVRATNIFVEKLKNRGFDAETILRKLQESIYGFDINSFACHLAETNLFFQVIDIVHKAKENNPNFVMDRFNIYQTDSLRIPEEKEKLNLFPRGLADYLIDAEIVKRIKLKQGEFKDGFDFVVGNPPYVRADSGDAFLKLRKEIEKQQFFETLYEKWDIYIPFIELGGKFLKDKVGKLGFIVSDAYQTAKYAHLSRKLLYKEYSFKQILFAPEIDLFEAAIHNCIFVVEKKLSTRSHLVRRSLLQDQKFTKIVNLTSLPQLEYGEKIFRIDYKSFLFYKETIPLSEICYTSVGMVLNADEKRYRGEFTKEDLISFSKDEFHSKAYIEGKDIDRYRIKRIKYLEYETDRVPCKIRRPTFFELYQYPKLMKGTTTGCIYDESGLLCNHSIIICVPYFRFKKVYNRSLDKERGKILKNSKLSTEFNLKYLLAILNSKLAKNFFSKIRRSKISLYPADIDQLPIKKASQNTQQEFVNLVDQILEINKNLPSFEAKVNNTQELLKDFDFILGDLADISGIRVELRDRIGKPRIKREELKVFLDIKSYIECPSEYMANYIELYLESLGDTLRGKTNSEVVDLIRIPKSPAQLQNILQKRQELLKQIEELKHRRAEIDKEIDEKVYKLYGLTEEEIKIVKGSD